MKERERNTRLAEATSTSDLVNRVLEGYHLDREVREVRLHLDWERLVGPRVAARTRPDGLKDGVLHVVVWDSSWLHQLSFLREDMIAGINQGMGDPPMVSELVLRIGRVASRGYDPPSIQRPARRPARRRSRMRFLPEPASPERADAIARETESIRDPELREQLAELRKRWNL